MQENWKDILANLGTDIDQETLLLYLQDKLSEEKKHEVEKKIADNEFASDALDGLREFRDKRQVAHTVEMLNRDLRKKVERKKQRRQKLIIPNQTWLFVAVLIFLLLIILSYLIVHRMRNGQ